MNRYLSTAALAARPTIYKALAITALSALAVGLLLLRLPLTAADETYQAMGAYPYIFPLYLAETASRSGASAACLAGFVALMAVMSLVSSPSAERGKNPNQLPPALVADVENTMDTLTETAGPALHFLLPGGTPLAAQLQLARAICRRAERRLWTLHRIDPVPEEILKYINRLSDLFFVMARAELARQDWPEERWKSFTYKRSSK